MKYTRHQVVVAGLVVSLLVGLHLTFRGLAGELPSVFPHIVQETPPEEIPILLSDLEDTVLEEKHFLALPPPTSPPTPAEALPPATAMVSDRAPLRTTQKLLRSTSVTPIDKLPPLRPGDNVVSFQITPALEPIVDFWRRVYAVYDKTQVALHDTDYLQIQYGVLDFSALESKHLSDEEKKSIREAEIRRETKRIQDILTELDTSNGVGTTKESRRIAALFEDISEEDKFIKAKDRIRSQGGLKHRFREGIANSGKYLPYFEQIFQSYGVPKEISRLAFVESIFREKAFSKVGAAGLWQFMPDTGRRYMSVDRFVDERYDPFVATHGAAKLLLHNYDLLGTWPLAINAYNSGPGNLLKAISKLGTRDITTIVTNFKSGSYAFASRNFYPSFLAALSVYENYEKYFGPIKKAPLMRFDTIELPSTLTFPEVALLSDVSLEDLEKLNPAFDAQVFREAYALPAGSQIRIPQGRQDTFAARFVNYPASTGSLPTSGISLVRSNDIEHVTIVPHDSSNE